MVHRPPNTYNFFLHNFCGQKLCNFLFKIIDDSLKLQGRESSEEELQNDWLDLEGTKSKKALDIGMVPSEKDCKIVMVLLGVAKLFSDVFFSFFSPLFSYFSHPIKNVEKV